MERKNSMDYNKMIIEIVEKIKNQRISEYLH